MKTNVKRRTPAPRTHNGALASRINAKEQLRRSLMACLLFEQTFYESGVSIAACIRQTAHEVNFQDVLAMAVEARTEGKLRHAPLWLINAALSHPHRPESRAQLVEAIDRVCARPDDMGELISLYWGGKKKPLAAALKVGLAKAFEKFDEYRLAKYAARGSIRLRDVMFLTHPTPKDKAQKKTWKRLADDDLLPADTWEVALSAGADKKETFTRLLQEGNLGGLATLRNLRNMKDAGVDKQLVAKTLLEQAGKTGIFPYQYFSAASAVPMWEDIIEPAMFAAVANIPKLKGKTVLLVDKSGSMDYPLSSKSQITRLQAAASLAVLLRELCEDVEILKFDTFIEEVKPRRGFALREQIVSGRHGGTDTRLAIDWANKRGADRIIVITDEQSSTTIPAPKAKFGYIMNVASYQNGIGYGPWTHISGFSENFFRYIVANEAENTETAVPAKRAAKKKSAKVAKAKKAKKVSKTKKQK